MKTISQWIKIHPIKIGAVVILVSLLLGLVYFFIFGDPYGGIGGGAAHLYVQRSGDKDRDRDMMNIRLFLEMYKDKYGAYPTDLRKLVDEKLTQEERIEDPVTKDIYQYALSNDAGDYILAIRYGVLPAGLKLNRYLKAAGEDLMARKLQNDLDGTLYGVNCDDPIYCVSGSKR